jgi:hypothetical protein
MTVGARFGSILLASMLAGCSSFLNDPSGEFPECVGTRDSFNPHRIAEPYLVTMRGADTFGLRMIFTDYNESLITTPNWPRWHLWVSSSGTSGTSASTTYYYDGFCLKSYETGKWYGYSGIQRDGKYASCDFDFDELSCRDVSGKCLVVIQETFDSLRYNFEGSKK